MSLLDRTNASVTVFPEESVVDSDGNTRTQPAAVGVVTSARVWPVTNSRPSESWDDGGFDSTSRYALRFPRSFKTVLGAQAQILWEGVRWSVIGDPISFDGSFRTRHKHYRIERS